MEVIISVGYRVNRIQATQFIIWATERLKEYIIKGFTLDDDRLKNPTQIFGKDYFEEHLACAKLKKKYEDVYLLRNEKSFQLYRFSDGKAFEPDFVLFQKREKE